MGTKKSLVAAAVLGMMAGIGCGGAQAAAANPRPLAPPQATSSAAASDKNGCGNHAGSGCGAVEAQPK